MPNPSDIGMLLGKLRDRWGRGHVLEGDPINPDGPEAASTIQSLQAENAALREGLGESRVALQHAANTFYRYAKLHRAKGTEDGDQKACANAGMGEEMNAAIASIDPLLSPEAPHDQ